MSYASENEGWVTPPAKRARGCPCELVEPCSPHCTCRNSHMSGGCRRCCRYGSQEQQLQAAQHLAQIYDLQIGRDGTPEASEYEKYFVALEDALAYARRHALYPSHPDLANADYSLRVLRRLLASDTR